MPVMQAACKLYEGTHDFVAFRGRKDDRQTTVREIFNCSIHRRGPIIIFAVEGNGFLYHMVRTMVGTVLDIGRGQGQPQRVTEAFVSGDRRFVGPCAPAEGLCLQWIRF
jgi:tRNA pseudouridine38-40 synthase